MFLKLINYLESYKISEFEKWLAIKQYNLRRPCGSRRVPLTVLRARSVSRRLTCHMPRVRDKVIKAFYINYKCQFSLSFLYKYKGT